MKCDIHPHGFCWGGVHGCVYGSEEACKELAAKFEELAMYQNAIGPLQSALDRIAAALEERLPPAEDANKIEALQAMLGGAEDRARGYARLNEDLRSDIRAYQANQEELIAKVGELREENNRLRQPDLGVQCKRCSKPITGIGAVAGAAYCLDCNRKRAAP